MGRPRNLTKDHVADAQSKPRMKPSRKTAQKGGGIATILKRLVEFGALDDTDKAYVLDGLKSPATHADLHALCRMQLVLPVQLYLEGELSTKDFVVAINKASTQWQNLINSQTSDETITSVTVDATVPEWARELMRDGGDRLDVH
jgi:hypothetical protein